MRYFKLHKDKSKCWWCGSSDLTGEHKMKKTELELLYGKVYPRGNSINHIKYKNESKGMNIQSSNSDRVKFEKNLCKNCNGSKSQDFDIAYQKLIEFYYKNRVQIKLSRIINLEEVFGTNWDLEYLNVKRYIGKHIGCRMSEIGLLPSRNLIAFLNGEEHNFDLKIFFQLKPYFIGEINEPIDSIFMGPASPINNSIFKFKNLVTSFCGWYTFANFSWNYLHEDSISKNTKLCKIIHLEFVDYKNLEGEIFSLNEDLLMSDWSNILDKLEYYPFNHGDKNIDYYNYVKNIVTNN